MEQAGVTRLSKYVNQPQLIQILTFRDRTYPLFLEVGRTRVIGNAEIDGSRLPRSMVLDFDLKTA